MDDLQRSVGRLEGKLDGIDSKVDALTEDFKVVKADLEIIKKYRWQLAGGATVVSVIASVIVRFVGI